MRTQFNSIVKINNIFSKPISFHFILLGCLGSQPNMGVPDMIAISDIDENGVNHNLKVRYQRDQIYVSFSFEK